MKTLKEILAERKRAAQSSQATAVMPNTDNQVAEQMPIFICSGPTSEFYDLFKDCTDF